MYPLGLFAFCSCGPKLFREAASLLFLGAARTPNPVGRGLAPAAASLLSPGAERIPNLVGTGGIRLRMRSTVRSNAKQNYEPILWGRGPTWHTVPFEQNRTAKIFANNF